MLKFWLPTSTNCFCHLVLPTHILCYQYHIVGLGAELITEKRRLSLLKLWHDSTKLLFQPCAFPNSWHLRSRMHGWILLWWHENPNCQTNFAFQSVGHLSLRRGFWCWRDGVVAIIATSIYVNICVTYVYQRECVLNHKYLSQLNISPVSWDEGLFSFLGNSSSEVGVR